MYSYCSSMYPYCCLCILIVVYAFLDVATLTEVFPCFFLGYKANARVILAKTGHGPHSSKIVVLFYVLFVLYRSMYCSCVNVYCHRVTTQLQLTNISNIKSYPLLDNVENYGRARQTANDYVIRRKHIACWITKAVDTHTEYVIFIAFPWQQWLHERTSVLRLYVHRLCCHV